MSDHHQKMQRQASILSVPVFSKREQEAEEDDCQAKSSKKRMMMDNVRRVRAVLGGGKQALALVVGVALFVTAHLGNQGFTASYYARVYEKSFSLPSGAVTIGARTGKGGRSLRRTNTISKHILDVAATATTRTDSAAAVPPDTEAVVVLAPEERREQELKVKLSEKTNDLSELSKGSFGGCLMIMDDNHFLVEWLAYHWHVLPLRHLFVLLDEKSQTSPLGIFDRWEQDDHSGSKKARMQIEVVDWTWPRVLAPAENVDPEIVNNTEIRHYIGRQNKFYEKCMQEYKARNWDSWIILTDTDEFIGNNRWQDNKMHPLFDGVIPSANETGSVMKRIQQMSHLGDKCILTNRTHSCEETNEIDTTYSTSLGFSDHDFLTFEWNMGHTLKNPKGMLDVGRIDQKFFDDLDLNNNGNAHNIAPGFECSDRDFFKMFHFPGSEEQRTFRDSIDPRGPAATRIGGSRPRIERKCLPMPTKHQHPWLGGFVRSVGQSEAKRLLDGVGKTGPWPRYQRRIMQSELPTPLAATAQT